MILFIIVISLGLLLDFYDFFIGLINYLRREKSSSGTVLAGFILVSIGLFGIKFFTESSISGFLLFLLLLAAFVVHISLQVLLPILITMLCNKYYGRKLFDDSPLPNK